MKKLNSILMALLCSTLSMTGYAIEAKIETKLNELASGGISETIRSVF